MDLTRTFSNHPKILVAALNGPVVGLPAVLVGFADFIYAAPHTFLQTPFSSLGLAAEGGASHIFRSRLGPAKAREALIMSKKIPCEELVACGFINKVINLPSGSNENAFVEEVVKEVNKSIGSHLNQSSLLKIKEMICQPDRDVLDRTINSEAYVALERCLAGAPQEQFRKIAQREKSKRSKL